MNKSIFKCKIVVLFVSKTRRCEHYEKLNTPMQCMFNSYSKPEGAVVLKVQSRLIEVSYDVINTAAITAAKLNKKHDKHRIETIYGLCVFPGNMLENTGSKYYRI